MRMRILFAVRQLDVCPVGDVALAVVEHKGYCPNCGSFNKIVLSGKDCTIKEIRIAKDA